MGLGGLGATVGCCQAVVAPAGTCGSLGGSSPTVRPHDASAPGVAMWPISIYVVAPGEGRYLKVSARAGCL